MMGAYPDPEPKINISGRLIPWIIVVVLGVTCAVLALRKPEEIVREVTRDVIKEVPRDVIKEVPKETIREVIREIPKEVVVEKEKELSAEEKAKLTFGELLYKAEFSKSGNDGLKNLPTFKPFIGVDDAIKGKVDVQELKTKLELKLREHGIPIDKDYGVDLRFIVEGLWNDDHSVFSYSASLSVHNTGFFFRTGEKGIYAQKNTVEIWSMRYTGYAGSNRIEDGIKRALDKASDEFANAYLEQNPKKR